MQHLPAKAESNDLAAVFKRKCLAESCCSSSSSSTRSGISAMERWEAVLERHDRVQCNRQAHSRLQFLSRVLRKAFVDRFMAGQGCRRLLKCRNPNRRIQAIPTANMPPREHLSYEKPIRLECRSPGRRPPETPARPTCKLLAH